MGAKRSNARLGPTMEQMWKRLGCAAAGAFLITGASLGVPHFINSYNSKQPAALQSVATKAETSTVPLIITSTAPVMFQPQVMQSVVPLHPRQALLNSLFAELKPEYLSHIEYDPDGLKRKEYFTKRLLELRQGVFVGSLDVPHYETAIFVHQNEIGTAKPSILFVGTLLFNKNYTEHDWRNVIMRGNRYAQIQSQGLTNVDTEKLREHINSGQISSLLVSNLRELEANLYGLVHESQASLSVVGLQDLAAKIYGSKDQIDSSYFDADDFSREVIHRVYDGLGLERPVPRMPAYSPVKRGKKLPTI